MIKKLIMDVDGTMTDGIINIAPSGELFKSFNVKDGYGIKMLINAGVEPIIITGRRSDIVSLRAKELEITSVYQGVSDKAECLQNIMEKEALSPDAVAYIGDDLNDLEAMKLVRHTFAPADASEDVLNYVDHRLNSTGGHGAIRECAEVILKKNQEAA